MNKSLEVARLLASLREVRGLNLLLDMGYCNSVFSGYSYGIPENSLTAIFLLRPFQFIIRQYPVILPHSELLTVP